MRINNIRYRIDEGISPILYHSTRVGNLRSILKTDNFRLTPDLGTQSDKELGHNTRVYYLSTTRHKLGGYGLIVGSGSTVLVLDGVKLNQRYTGKPVDYWGAEFRKVAPDKAEAEDRIYSNKRTIPNATSYIKEVHMFIDIERPDKRIAVIRNWRGVLIELKKKGIPYWIYDNNQAYLIQNKSKAISVPMDILVAQNKDDIKQTPWFRGKKDYLSPWVELYYKKSPDQLSEKASEIRSRLMYTYDAQQQLTSLKNDFHNQKNDETTGVDTIINIMRKEGLRTLDEFLNMLIQKWKPLSD